MNTAVRLAKINACIKATSTSIKYIKTASKTKNGEVPQPKAVFIAPKMKMRQMKLRIMMWPEIMFAKRRMIKANGFVKMPSTSTGIIIGFTPIGTGGLNM